MSSVLDPVLASLGDGGPGEELARLQQEWQQLEQRRSRLSERAAASASSSSHFSMSALMPAPNEDRSSPRDLSPSHAWTRAGAATGSPVNHAALEEEHEALRAALGSRTRGGPLSHAFASGTRRALSPRGPEESRNRAVDESRHRAADESRHRSAEDREREREREWREKMRAIEEEKGQMRVLLEENQEVTNLYFMYGLGHIFPPIIPAQNPTTTYTNI